MKALLSPITEMMFYLGLMGAVFLFFIEFMTFRGWVIKHKKAQEPSQVVTSVDIPLFGTYRETSTQTKTKLLWLKTLSYNYKLLYLL